MRTPFFHVHFLAHRAAGAGVDDATVEHLGTVLRFAMGGLVRAHAHLCASHATVRSTALQLLREAGEHTVLVAVGGSGTLRQVAEAVMTSSRPRCATAVVRAGSGNVAARNVGVPADLLRAVYQLAQNLKAQRFLQLPLMRVRTLEHDGVWQDRLATGLVGLGQLGRVPGDVAWLRSRLGPVRRQCLKHVSLEQLNRREYALATAVRLLAARVHPSRLETVRLQAPGLDLTGTLACGVASCLPVGDLPAALHRAGAPQGVTLQWLTGDDLLQGPLSLAALANVRRRCWLGPGDTLRVTSSAQAPGMFFVDEDPYPITRSLELSHGGWLTVVRGGDCNLAPQTQEEDAWQRTSA